MTNDTGVYDFCMNGSHKRKLSDSDLDVVMQAQEAQQAFEIVMAQTARTKFGNDASGDLHVRLALSDLIGSWNCLIRSRAAVGGIDYT